jgi:hypothetical protein
MNSMTLKQLACAALALTGLLHLVLAPEYLAQEAYVGGLFIAGGLASLGIAVWLWHSDDALAWSAGALVCAGMALGFIFSRTIGLPGFQESEWELSGILSVLLELGVVGAAVASLRTPRSRPAEAKA